MRAIFVFPLLFLTLFIRPQAILNGDFENHSATHDEINLSNKNCNEKLWDVNSFGSYGDVDIITSATYGGGGAAHGKWFIGMTGGKTDVIAMKLSAPLKKGTSYTISFQQRVTSGYPAHPVEIGLSATDNEFGTLVYKAAVSERINMWTTRSTTFTASTDAQFITVQMSEGTLYTWINLDNFVLAPTKCAEKIELTASADLVHAGTTVTIKAAGPPEILWTVNDAYRAMNKSAITLTPEDNCTVKVTNASKGCPALTASLTISVIKPEVILADTSKEIVKKDSANWEPDVNNVKHKKWNGRKVNGRKFVVQESVTVNSEILKILVWDKNRADGDQVSIYLNGELVAESFTVSKVKKELLLNLEPGKNIIAVYAINLGLIPPNTSALSIMQGKRTKHVTLVSTLKKSGALEVIYDPHALTVK